MKVLKTPLLFLVLIVSWGSVAPALAKESKPNILVIFGDDNGSSCLYHECRSKSVKGQAMT